MKVAYLVLSHRPPTQLRRLLATLRDKDPTAPLIVHHDRFSSSVSAADIDVGGRVELLSSDHPINWGDFSLVETFWRMLAWMIEHVDFDWVVLLSAQDYPIEPLTELHRMLETTDGDAIISARSIEEIASRDERADLRYRYYYQYAKPIQLGINKHLPVPMQTALRSGARIGADTFNRLQSATHVYKFPPGMSYRYGRRAHTTPFSSDAPCWHASVWVTLNHKAAEAVLRRQRGDPSFVRYYQSTVLCDESVTATILCNDPGIRVVLSDIHHVRWSNALTGHPDTFSVQDFDELAASTKQFARKFDIASDSVILDRLDELVARA